MKNYFPILIAFTCSLLLTCRNSVEPPLLFPSSISLSAEYVGIAEASLRIHVEDTSGTKAFRLTRNRQTIFSAQYAGVDTLITDTTLLRGRSYIYKAFRLLDTLTVDSSDAVLVHTIDSASIALTVEPLVTEAELQITINDRNPIRSFKITRDGLTRFIGTLAGRDTTIFDNGLIPSSSYSYKVFRLDTSTEIDSSASVSVTTLDTTSHNFTWQVDTIGALGSTLNDVAIINDNDIWAVGYLYGRDSTGQIEPQPYNVAHWDGSKWILSRATYVPLNAVFSISSNDIWAGSSAPYRWDGSTWTGYDVNGIFNGYIKKIWASSDNNVFIVGTNGSIAHFNGSVWTKMESGTDVDLLDVWGSPDGSVVWACGWTDTGPARTVLLRLTNNVWEKAYEDQNHLFAFRSDSISGPVFSVWTDNKRRVFALTNYDLYKCPEATRGDGETMWNGLNPYIWGGLKVRGTAINNVVVAGAEGRIWHFNGQSWKLFENLINPLDRLYSVAITENQIVAVGERYYNGIEYFGVVYRGSR